MEFEPRNVLTSRPQNAAQQSCNRKLPAPHKEYQPSPIQPDVLTCPASPQFEYRRRQRKNSDKENVRPHPRAPSPHIVFGRSPPSTRAVRDASPQDSGSPVTTFCDRFDPRRGCFRPTCAPVQLLDFVWDHFA
ncbi:hypothetical protein BaRGS_00005065 [Batillaria attramentaria]|uniref:Uncharacterized protein n=1 Tax=Batillaria attramentaria TaxID=370345 RepID=A0ABD0LWJ4_9CAEN